ncbi:MAG: citrate transporter [Acidobacteria bacterium]|nr:citrate transporter [Acidobacteriota bacterium]
MLAALIILIFLVFAALMLTRRMPAILAVPAMAVLMAVAARTPFAQILNDVIVAGSRRLVDAYLMVLGGAMLGRVVMQTGIAEGLIKRAAEFGGDRPLAVAITMMAAITLLFTTLTGLGAIIMVGGLTLPIMMSLGVPRKLAGVLFLFAYGLGVVFNIASWGLYKETLKLESLAAISQFANYLFAIDAALIVAFLFYAARRMASYGAWAARMDEDAKPKGVPLIALLIPILPLALHKGLAWPVLAAFIISAIIGVLLTRPREIVQQLASSAVKGFEDVAAAVILMIGIGMLLNTTELPAVKASLAPLVQGINFRSPMVYVAFFGLLSPLALYRGPLNLYGVGIGLYSLLSALNLLPSPALVAAVMSVVQVQTVSDPTNTHNVWIANYVGVRVEELTRATLLWKVAVCVLGLIVGAWLYLR